MTIRVYRSTDAGAASLTLNNTAGKLLAILDACLVNGYAVGTVLSITRSGTTATITFSGEHGLLDRGNYATIAGVDQAEYNGEFELIPATSTTATFTVSGSPATPATGTITATKSGSGWTKPYSGTNKAADLQGAGSNGFYFRVDDTGTTNSRAVGYESMSDVDTGTAAFPTGAQFSGGLYLPKSNGSPNREWIIIATSKYFYLYTSFDGSVTGAPLIFFGDIDSDLYVTDVYCTAILAGTGSFGFSSGNGVSGLSSSFSAGLDGNYIARSYQQTGGSLKIGKSSNHVMQGASGSVGSAGAGYPDPVTNGLLHSPIYVIDPSVSKRGALPGALGPLHNRPLTHLDVFVGTGDYAGKTFLVLSCYPTAQVFVQIA
jgi:hypothetical protein